MKMTVTDMAAASAQLTALAGTTNGSNTLQAIETTMALLARAFDTMQELAQPGAIALPSATLAGGSAGTIQLPQGSGTTTVTTLQPDGSTATEVLRTVEDVAGLVPGLAGNPLVVTAEAVANDLVPRLADLIGSWFNRNAKPSA